MRNQGAASNEAAPFAVLFALYRMDMRLSQFEKA